MSTSTRIAVVLLASATLWGCVSHPAGNAGDGARVTISKQADADALDVVVDGQLFTTYHFSNDNLKPFLWPVLGEGGVPMTRPWPMGEAEDKTDHPHHKSFWTAYGDLNGADCWAEGDNSGRQVSGTPEFGSGDDYGWIKVVNSWQNHDGAPVITEAREYRFYAGPPDARAVDVAVTFTATEGDVLFKDTKEGGIVSLRVRDCIRADRSGTITNALGGAGEKECWGKPSPWCDYSGPFEDGKVRGITVMDHPSNLRHPSRWHVRNYGLMGANCFGLSHFTKGEAEQLNGDYTLKKGESLTFHYRVLVHSGTPEQAKVAERFAEYAASKP
ncbi:MAG: PmoA family protein [Candidatus Hydrogenedentes bacterium]|nr:PmoA family protein [Candidatus Hydrogenedentota bacterium]